LFDNRENRDGHGDINSCCRKRLKMNAEKLIISTDSLTMHAERLNCYKEIKIVQGD